jgi:hypothetical protein
MIRALGLLAALSLLLLSCGEERIPAADDTQDENPPPVIVVPVGASTDPGDPPAVSDSGLLREYLQAMVPSPAPEPCASCPVPVLIDGQIVMVPVLQQR